MVLLYSDDIDVYSIPHQRMKNAINSYVKQISITNFTNICDFKFLLKSLSDVFTEFEIHERIENECIIKELKSKLAKLSIKNSKICECHKDSKLKEMRKMFESGLTINMSQLSDFSYKLRDAFSEFTHNFIPHMEEEEQYFQPLLMTYFSYEELRNLKKIVMSRHSIEAYHLFYGLDQTMDSNSIYSCKEAPSDATYSHSFRLPSEIMLKIFGYLSPKDLLIASRVERYWRDICRSSILWPSLSPLKWISDEWKFHDYNYSGNSSPCLDYRNHHTHYYDATNVPEMDRKNKPTINELTIPKSRLYNESKVLIGMIKYLLPHIGSGLKILDLSGSTKLNNFFLKKILSYCPRLECLDVSYTNISDAAFVNWYALPGSCNKLRRIDLSGCPAITDLTLLYLSRGLTKLNCPKWGIEEFTDVYYMDLKADFNTHVQAKKDDICKKQISDDFCHSYCSCSQTLPNQIDDNVYIKDEIIWKESYDDSNSECSLEWLGLSGCYKITDRGLRFLTRDYLFRTSHITLPSLSYLDLSGLPHITANGLAYLLGFCSTARLLPENIYYCDNVMSFFDAILNLDISSKVTTNSDDYIKFDDIELALIERIKNILNSSNGCKNLECGERFCCRLAE
ncbi:unnamed protein product [Gordionus sp. m RMFG-2023]|uniref:F-box/LRR-repeat protein 5-like isoform X2 n=1 Tax=Gordionus sp. m RMFG-2023 TaxID=3053472 RepID=UPI0030E1BDEB